MKIEVRERPYKTVLFWMSREEADNEDLMASLNPQFSMQKTKKIPA